MTTKEFEALPSDVRVVVGAICKELLKAMDKHKHWPTKDVIHAAAIVGEESGELIRAALQYNYETGSSHDVSKEAIHTGAMAIRFLLNR